MFTKIVIILIIISILFLYLVIRIKLIQKEIDQTGKVQKKGFLEQLLQKQIENDLESKKKGYSISKPKNKHLKRKFLRKVKNSLT